MSPLFLAIIKATEKAIYNSLFRATTVKERDDNISEQLPLAETLKILRKYGRIKSPEWMSRTEYSLIG